jgi:hypothetical protein
VKAIFTVLSNVVLRDEEAKQKKESYPSIKSWGIPLLGKGYEPQPNNGE